MKRLMLAILTAANIATPFNAVAAPIERSRNTAPTLHLMMDLDRQSGLEQIFKSTVETPIPANQICPGQPWREKAKKQVLAKFEIVDGKRVDGKRVDGKRGKRSTIFEHDIGTNLATYWVHEIREVRHINQDEFVDLVFYTGDDTSEETVLLLRKQDHYKAIYAGTAALRRDGLGSVIPGGNNRIYYNTNNSTRWDAEQEVFVGEGMAWVIKDCAAVRKTPADQGELLFSLSQNNLVELLETQGTWQKIRMDGREGWIEARSLSGTSPTRVFPIK